MSSAADFVASLREMAQGTTSGPFDWAGPIEDRAKWLRETNRRTLKHGDAQEHAWAVQTRDQDIVVAYCGNGPNAHRNAELIAFLLNNVEAITAALQDSAIGEAAP